MLLSYESQVEELFSRLKGSEEPHMQWEQTASREFSVALICPHRRHVAQFFFEMVSRWLLPGRPLEVVLSFATSYREYAICEMVIRVEEGEDALFVKRSLPFLEKEICLGVSSIYHASRILEMKGLSLSAKTSLIQERIAELIRRFPAYFDYDLFEEMQHFLVSVKEEFKAVRDISHMSRMIWVPYLMRKALEKKIEEEPGKRHISLKIKKILLQTPFGSKEVLALFVGLNFLRPYELFEERHLLYALARFGVRPVPHSYMKHEGFCYLEVEIDHFSQTELMQGLPEEILRRIEQLVPPIFMPRNEEEVMRSVLTLSNQLKFTRDIPQIAISFEGQRGAELLFTIVLVRLLHPHTPPLRELFAARTFTIDRVKIVGHLRRKYPKEATVLRARLKCEDFLRDDFSVDLYQARMAVLRTVQQGVGEVRDYNGGMIAKQNENYELLKKELGELAERETLLLQNFFHSISPVELSATLDPVLLKSLFTLLLDALGRPESLLTRRLNGCLLIVSKEQDLSGIESLKIPHNELLIAQVQLFDSSTLALLYLNPDKEKQKKLLLHI